jgi:hypothetical protein
MQNPRTGMRWIAAAIASISITTVTHAASVAPVAAENGMVVAAQHLASKVGVEVLSTRQWLWATRWPWSIRQPATWAAVVS